MKCHAGVEFPQGKPCPKCNAKLGEVCWPGINADLAELPKLRTALKAIMAGATAINRDPNWPGEAKVVANRLYKIASLALKGNSDATLTQPRAAASEINDLGE